MRLMPCNSFRMILSFIKDTPARDNILPRETFAVPSSGTLLIALFTIGFASESKQETVPLLSTAPLSISFCVISYSPVHEMLAACGHSSGTKNKIEQSNLSC